MNFFHFFSIGGKLERAESALSQHRFDKASLLFDRAWSKLNRLREKGRPNKLDEQRALVGLVRTSIQTGTYDQALGYCRTGRSLSLDEDIFYELPCSKVLAKTDKPSTEELNDLLAWVCWRKASKSFISVRQVEQLLKNAFLPLVRRPSRDWQSTESGKALIRLEQSSSLWSWPSLYCAELARLSGIWTEAASLLGRAVDREKNSEKRARFLWNQAHCLYLAGRAKEAAKVGRQAILLLPPQTSLQWRLAVRLGLSAISGAGIWQTVVAGVHKYPSDHELLLHLKQMCESQGQWNDAMSLTSELIPKTSKSDELFALLLWLRCTAALRLKNTAVATECAQLIIGNLGRIHSDRSVLCLYASIILTFHGNLNIQRAQVLFENAADAAKVRIGLVAAWSAIAARSEKNLEICLRLLDQCPAQNLPGPEWTRLRYLASLAWLADCPNSLEFCHSQLQGCIAEAGSFHAASLHAYALSSMALAARNKANKSQATEYLFASIGAWASLLHDEKAVLCFFGWRYLTYSVNAELPGCEEIGKSFVFFLFGFVEKCLSQQAEAKQLRSSWELEQHALGFVAQLGGLPLNGPASPAIVAGPYLARALGLKNAVRRLIETHEEKHREDSWRTDLALLANLLGHEIGPMGSGDPVKQRAIKEFRRLFSPLGPAALLLEQQRFDEAMSVLNGGTHQLSLIQKPLKEFTSSNGGQKWVAQESQKMNVECALQSSKILVGHVPVGLDLVRQAWSHALQHAHSCGIVPDVRRYIGEIAVGRGNALFRKRAKEERLADEVDRRPNAERHTEALALMSLSWDMTGDSSIQGPYAECLNYAAVEAGNKRDFHLAAEILLRSLQVNPGMRRAADNFSAVVLAQLQEMFGIEEGSDAAGNFLLTSMNALRSIDRNSSLDEIQRCLATLADQGSTPFFNLAGEAQQRGDWREATQQMIWCLRIAPHDTQIGQAAIIVGGELREQIARGRLECRHLLAELSQYFPEELRALQSFFEQLSRIQTGRA